MSTIKFSSVSPVSIQKLAIAFLWLVSVMVGLAATPLFNQQVSAYGANNQTECVALGGTWEAPNASNRGAGNCSGQGPCEASGGIWTGQSRMCTTVGKTYRNDSMDNKIKAYNYYVALSSGQCNFGGSITGADIGNYVWLLGSNPHLSQASRGSLDCNQRDGKDGKWLQEAMSLFNIPGGSAGEKLCSLGMTQTSVSNESLRTSCGGSASTGGDKFEWKNVESKRSSVLSTIRKWYFNNQEPTFSDAMTYHVALQDFFNPQLCSASTTPAATYSSGSSGSKSFTIQVVEGGRTVPKEYTVTGDNQQKTGELYNISALGGSRYVVSNVPCADYPANANSGGSLPTLGSILSQRKYADAYVRYIAENSTDNTLITDPSKATAPEAEVATTSCAIEGVGWIVCPIITFLGDITDKAYTYIADNFLQVDNGLVANGSGTNTAWGYMRNIANIVFVIVFLFIIFSQLTGQGIANYGVKKMLPRLIIAAILVNVSFFICQLAVDLSNILGVSLKDMLSGIGAGFDPVATAADQSTNWAGIIVAVLAGTGIAWALGLPVLIPFLLAAVVGVLMTFMILVLRQVLIVLLVVLAPIAFVAFILPNTEQWFTKWRKMFVGLLLVFPTIGLLFGAASLASDILKTVYSTGSGNSDIIGLIIAHGVLVLPLFLLPSLLKASLNAVGNIGAKLNGMSSKMQGATGKQASKAYSSSRLGQYDKYREGERAKRRALIQSGAYSGKGGRLNPRNWASSANKAVNESRLSGSFGDRSLTTGTALADKEDAELVANAGSRLDNMSFIGANGTEVPLSQHQMMQIATGKDVTDDSGKVLAAKHTFDESTRRAAIVRAGKIATVADAHELVDASRSMSKVERKTLVSSLAGSSAVGKAPYLGGKTLGQIEQGTASSELAALTALKDGKVSSEALAGGDKNSIKKLIDAANSTPAGSRERMALKAAYADIDRPNSRLREKIVTGGDHDLALREISNL